VLTINKLAKSRKNQINSLRLWVGIPSALIALIQILLILSSAATLQNITLLLLSITVLASMIHFTGQLCSDEEALLDLLQEKQWDFQHNIYWKLANIVNLELKPSESLSNSIIIQGIGHQIEEVYACCVSEGHNPLAIKLEQFKVYLQQQNPANPDWQEMRGKMLEMLQHVLNIASNSYDTTLRLLKDGSVY